jgi:hypothetical protein
MSGTLTSSAPVGQDEARDLVLALMQQGMSVQAVARLLDGRVSSRTVYRWSKGQCVPQQSSDLEALRRLVHDAREPQ